MRWIDRLPGKTRRWGIITVLLALFGLAWVGTSLADALDVSTAARQRADSAIEWCATPASAKPELIIGGGCQLEPLTASQVAPGADRRAFWMRLKLRNPGAEAVERWISVGHPRLAEVTLFAQGPSGLARRDIGKRTPMSQRGDIERRFDVMPVSLGPGETRSVWLRVWSDTAVDLSTTLWRPDDYIRHHQLTQFWVTLSLGGLFVAALFAVMMLGVTREQTYAFFALCLSGALFNIAYNAGLAQRFLWPMNWPLRSEYVAVSVLAALVGYFGFIRAFLPSNVRGSQIWRLFGVSVMSTAIALVYGAAVDYSAAVYVWNSSLLIVVALAAALTYSSWRRGDGAAGLLFLSFLIVLGWGALRLMLAVGGVIWFSEAAFIGPWAATLGAAIALLSLMDRSREQLARLAVVQAENEARLTFLAHMSHELRSPLDTILGNAQLLARPSHASASAASLASIFQSGRHMLQLIDHILDYARGLAGVIKISDEPVRLASFLRSIDRMARLHAAKQNNHFILRRMNEPEHGDSLELLLDAGHLRRVLDNLISNAARHTRGGVITLEVGTEILPENLLCLDFSVSDTGEGIAAENLQRIFQPFERGAQRDAGDGKGAGLGLAIARQLTELMGGRLTVSSEAGKGARFSFSIAARITPAGEETRADELEGFDAADYLGRRRTILIVDDQISNRVVLGALLRDLGFLVVEAESGVQAAELLKRLPELDLVITDQFMPNGDGWMVLERLFAEKPDVPAFLVSAAPPGAPSNWPPGREFSATFLRPLDHRRLVQRIGDLLGLSWAGTKTLGDHPQDRPPKDDASAAVGTEGADIADGEPLVQADWLVFVTLVQTGQVTALEGWAAELKARSPIQAPFADRIIAAARELDMETLRTLAGIG